MRGQVGQDVGAVVQQLLRDHLLVQAARVGGSPLSGATQVGVRERNANDHVVMRGAREVCSKHRRGFSIGEVGEQHHE